MQECVICAITKLCAFVDEVNSKIHSVILFFDEPLHVIDTFCYLSDFDLFVSEFGLDEIRGSSAAVAVYVGDNKLQMFVVSCGKDKCLECFERDSKTRAKYVELEFDTLKGVRYAFEIGKGWMKLKDCCIYDAVEELCVFLYSSLYTTGDEPNLTGDDMLQCLNSLLVLSFETV